MLQLRAVAEPDKRAPAQGRASRALVERRCRTAASAPGVVYMAQPLEREAVLAGYTYKLKWPGSDHAIYITINDIEQNVHAGGVTSTRRRPFEIFINTKNLEHYAWTVALTRMISAIFRRGGDVTFVAEELKAVFDPQGGQWMGGPLRAEPARRHRRGHRDAHDPHRLPATDETLPVDQAQRQEDAAAQSGGAVRRPGAH